jgi:predicted DNA binding CopG/RHH family protein
MVELKFPLPSKAIVFKTIFKDRRFKYLMEEIDEVNSRLLQKTAKEFVKKDEPKMNMRISSSELDKIKARAEREGLKYQTFIKSILHRYITNQLGENKGQL